MKKLEDFECEKVEVKNINGGTAREAYTFCKVSADWNEFDGMEPDSN
ncbi:hypothetical protein [Flavobacterium sp.]